MSVKYLREKNIITEKIPVAKATFRRWIQQGVMPPPIKLSSRCSVWRESDIDAAIEKMADEGVSE